MKHLAIILLVVGISAAPMSTVQASNSNESGNPALEYLEKVNVPFVEMRKEIWQYLKAITTGRSARKVERKRKKLLDELSSAKSETRKLKAFEGDASLKEAALEYLTLSQTVMKEEYSKILDMEEIAEKSYDNMEAYLTAKEEANDHLEAASEKFKAAYNDFAARNNIEIRETEDELSKKINEASDALEYYNDVFLIFFKSYKQEAYVLDAMSRNDVSGFQQNMGSLKSISDEGLKALDEAEPYKGSRALLVAAEYIIKFYQGESEDEFPEMLQFFLKKDRMDKMSEGIQSMKDADRTQEVIDRYNKESEAFNKSAEEFNSTNSRLNSKRQEYLNKWNEAVATFLAKHSG